MHKYCIAFADKINTPQLLPSSDPFAIDESEVSADEPLLFTMIVDDDWRPEEHGREIGQFDCGGNNHGVYRLADGGYRIELTDFRGNKCAIMQADESFANVRVALTGNYQMRNFGLNNMLMMSYAFASADKDTLLVHASVVRKDGFGYLCLGVSGTGKSTHTSLWLKHIEGTDLMNDDNPVVRVCPDGVARVFGSPWSGKTPCYRNISAPIGGFLQLRQAPYNKITPCTVTETFASLLPSCSVMKWDRRDYISTCQSVNHVMERTKMWLLECLPDKEAALLSYSTMTNREKLID